jgi:hypothetical protein
MQRHSLHASAAKPAPAWTQPGLGYVPGNDFGISQDSSYGYVIVGGGQ